MKIPILKSLQRENSNWARIYCHDCVYAYAVMLYFLYWKCLGYSELMKMWESGVLSWLAVWYLEETDEQARYSSPTYVLQCIIIWEIKIAMQKKCMMNCFLSSEGSLWHRKVENKLRDPPNQITPSRWQPALGWTTRNYNPPFFFDASRSWTWIYSWSQPWVQC